MPDLEQLRKVSPTLARLIEEVRNEQAGGPSAYDRVYNRHMGGGGYDRVYNRYMKP